ncbi:MAG: glutathione S-transferase family protein [Pseudomonadota bacterium]
MIVYGRNLSPFVRRVVMWLMLQQRAFEQRAVAMTEAADRETLRAVNPVMRVPTVVCDDGAVLTECAAICDWLDETAPAHRLVPASGAARRDCLSRIAIVSAATDKGVALFYEAARRPEAFRWADWMQHLTGQVTGGMGQLEALAPAEGFFGGDRPDGSDLAATCLMDFVPVTSPHLLEGAPYPALAALAGRVNALPGLGETRPR